MYCSQWMIILGSCDKLKVFIENTFCLLYPSIKRFQLVYSFTENGIVMIHGGSGKITAGVCFEFTWWFLIKGQLIFRLFFFYRISWLVSVFQKSISDALWLPETSIIRDRNWPFCNYTCILIMDIIFTILTENEKVSWINSDWPEVQHEYHNPLR